MPNKRDRPRDNGPGTIPAHDERRAGSRTDLELPRLRQTGAPPTYRGSPASLASAWLHRRTALLAAIGLVLSTRVIAASPRVDVIQLRNGDRITCEIRQLAQGQLSIRTDSLGSVTVHWAEVAGLTSPRNFDITTAAGLRFFGQLGVASEGRVTILGGVSPTELLLADVIAIVPIGRSLWNRVDGNISAGFGFAQAQLERHWTLNGTASYRSRSYALTGTVASQITSREDAESLSRNSLSLSANRLLPRRWFAGALGQVQQNEELDLDLRTVVGAGFGREYVHSNHTLWSGFAGLAYTSERFSGQPVEQSAEAVLGGALNFFTPRKDETSFTNSIITFYDLTGRARIRLEVQSSWRHQFLGDFNWGLDGYESFDSSPPANGKRNDASVGFSVGWKF